MKKQIMALLLLAALPAWAPALANDWENALITDRPDGAEASETVGKLRLQIETSFGFDHDAQGGTTTNTYNFPTLLRLGLIDWLEFRIESPMGQFQKQTGQAHTQGWNDLEFGFKAHVLDNDGWVPSMGFLAHLTTPTGSNHYSGESYDPVVKWINDWDLPLGVGVGTNIGFDVPQNGGRFARVLYAAAFSGDLTFLTDRLGVFVEVQGALPVQTPQPDEHTFDTGFTFLVTPDIQLDTFVQLGLTDASTDLSTGLGFSWRVL